MQYRISTRLQRIIAFGFLFLFHTFFLKAQHISIPFDTAVVEVIERIPAPHNQQPTPVNNCGYEPNIRGSNWILMHGETGEAMLCNADTGEIHELPLRASWTSYESGDFIQPSLSPNSEWIVLAAYGDEQYDYYAVSVNTDDVISVGSIPYNTFATYPPYSLTWLSPTQGAVVHRTNSDSVWDTLYGFDLSVPNTMNEIMRGYPHAISGTSSRIESLYSGRWLSRKAGTSMGDMPCEFAIYDAKGLRVYPLEYGCQVEAYSADPNNVYDVIRSDGEAIIVLRVINFDSGQSELISLPVTTPDAEPIILYRGEIDYMLENAGGTTLSVLGTDGRIPNTVYEEYWLVDLRQFVGSDLLLTTPRGVHVIPSNEVPNNLSDFFIGILATSPDKSRVLLSNGSIYDVVEDRLVANITGGALINNSRAAWLEDGRLVFTILEGNPATDEPITIRLRGD